MVLSLNETNMSTRSVRIESVEGDGRVRFRMKGDGGARDGIGGDGKGIGPVEGHRTSPA